ncbi:MAG: hypothetical protein N2691_00635 [Patescibacteria group bacterium]|nr:hypothetical protein [Patescibacteria group bacterium]
MTLMRSPRFGVILLFLVIGAALIWRNMQMTVVPLADWDESIYARIGYELAQSPSLETTYNGKPWMEKPPLINYLLGIVHAATDGNVFWLRMISVAFAMATLGVTYILTVRLIVPARKGISAYELELLRFLPVFLLLGTPLFVERATLINYDQPLALGWVAYLAATSVRWKLLALVIGVSSKSLLGFFPVVFDLFRLKRKDYSWKTFRDYSLLAVVPLIWHLAALATYGYTFVQQHIIDHMIRRVVDPIELHFGGRLFYARELWNQYGFLAIVFGAAYLYLLFTILVTTCRKKVPPYFIAVLSAPLVYLAFLTFSATKIWWYILPVLPLMGLVLPFALSAIPVRWIRITSAIVLSLFLLYRFGQQTLFFQPKTDQSAKHILGRCIAKLPGDRIAFLVDENERKIKQVFEAAQIGISSSFIYGGSPAFVYYSKKQVAFFYDVDSFRMKYSSYPLAVFALADQNVVSDDDIPQPLCQSGGWIAIRTTEGSR